MKEPATDFISLIQNLFVIAEFKNCPTLPGCDAWYKKKDVCDDYISRYVWKW